MQEKNHLVSYIFLHLFKWSFLKSQFSKSKIEKNSRKWQLFIDEKINVFILFLHLHCMVWKLKCKALHGPLYDKLLAMLQVALDKIICFKKKKHLKTTNSHCSLFSWPFSPWCDNMSGFWRFFKLNIIKKTHYIMDTIIDIAQYASTEKKMYLD